MEASCEGALLWIVSRGDCRPNFAPQFVPSCSCAGRIRDDLGPGQKRGERVHGFAERIAGKLIGLRADDE